MKTSFIQIFDKKDDAEKALGFISGAYPAHDHSLVASSNQIQVWTTIESKKEAKTYGAPNAELVYVVISIAPA